MRDFETASILGTVADIDVDGSADEEGFEAEDDAELPDVLLCETVEEREEG